MVNTEFYFDVLRCLQQDIRRNRPELQRVKGFLLYRDNAPFHSSVCNCEFLTKNSMTVILHPIYSPDLAPFQCHAVPLYENEVGEQPS